ncbi:MAG: hypothetical protein JO189_07965, partial [Deltaproteobacteria bacterium]|nr:hypothetical protein [Deltaproteobacteria bacterium]
MGLPPPLAPTRSLIIIAQGLPLLNFNSHVNIAVMRLLRAVTQVTIYSLALSFFLFFFLCLIRFDLSNDYLVLSYLEAAMGRATKLFLLVSSISLFVSSNCVAETTDCRAPGINDLRELPAHLRQADIVSGKIPLSKVISDGLTLMITDFNRCDGRGRPGATGNPIPQKRPIPPELIQFFTRTSGQEAMSCAACHNQPQSLGSGDHAANVLQFPAVAVIPAVREWFTPTFSPNFPERNTPTIFGTGPVELLGREMTEDLQGIKADAQQRASKSGKNVSASLDTKGINFGSITAFPNGSVDTSGVVGVDPDLIVKPFQRKGALVSLREFAITASNQHMGMQAVERFGSGDFDDDGVKDELSIGDATAMALRQATLPIPERTAPPEGMENEATRGEELFNTIGCANCHVPKLPLRSTVFCDPNPFNPPGNLTDQSQRVCVDLKGVTGLNSNMVPLFSDLKRHVICDARKPHFCSDPPNHLQVTDRLFPVPVDEFITTKLWDMGNSAPYGHRGDESTLYEAIVDHGGEATTAEQAYETLSSEDQLSVVIFLRTLKAPI